jgi:uncharacterized membrane protein
MHMTAGIIPDYMLWIYNIVAAIAVIVAIWRMKKGLLFDNEQGLIIGIAYALLCGLYLLQAGVKPGMTVHFLGVMLTVMMFGPWEALLLLTAVHLTLVLGFGVGDLVALGFNISLCVVLPVVVAAGVHTFVYYKLPRTFPVYILQVGIGDILCMWVVAFMLSGHLLVFAVKYPSTVIFQDFLLVLIMMGGMEAMISTMVASLLVCFVPQALTTFSDEEYLHGK